MHSCNLVKSSYLHVVVDITVSCNYYTNENIEVRVENQNDIG